MVLLLSCAKNTVQRFINGPNKWPLIKLNFFGPKPRFAQLGLKKLSMLYLRWFSCTNSYCQLIRSYLDNFKFSKIMVALSIQNLYSKFSKINPTSTHQGYPPWGALALIRVWPWIKLNVFGPKPRFVQMRLKKIVHALIEVAFMYWFILPAHQILPW